MKVTLRLKINAAIFLTCVLAGMAAGAFLLTFETNRTKARFEETHVLLENIFNQKREDLANEIFAGKDLALRQSLDDILRFKGIYAATVYDQGGIPIQGTRDELQRPLPLERLRDIAAAPQFERIEQDGHPLVRYSNEIQVIGERIGFIDIYFDLKNIDEESRLTLTLFFSVIAGLLICMSLLLNTLLGQSVIVPVKRLAIAMRSIGEGEVGKTVKPQGSDEIGLMTEAFNSMSTQLRHALMEKDENSQDLEHANRLLAHKAAELARANRRLRDLDRMKSSFLSSVSHELRTPLTSVRGFAKLIRKDYLKICTALSECDEKTQAKMNRIRDNLEIIEQESDRLTAMVNDVLDLSRIEDGCAQWREEPVDTGKLLMDAARTAQGFLVDKGGVDFVTELPEGLPALHADHDRLMQVLTNLLSNAAKFTDKGQIKLFAKANGTNLRIGVSDTGPGIPPEELEKIFDKFHQSLKGDLLENKPRGTGLGLAICKQIITYYKGRIWAEAAQGEGSVFHIELPLNRYDAPEPGAA